MPAPQVICGERAPGEAIPTIPRTQHYREWAAYARRWMGVATAEVTKRKAVADCLDELRAKGVIR